MDIDDKIRIRSDNDNDCYDNYRNQDLVITHIAYSIDDHPGYDSGMEGSALVDCQVHATGESVPFSLYEYEFELV